MDESLLSLFFPLNIMCLPNDSKYFSSHRPIHRPASSFVKSASRMLSTQKRMLSSYNDYDDESAEYDESSGLSDLSAEEDDKDVVQIGRAAPSFLCTAVDKGKIIEIDSENFKGKFIVLFFYPLNFTFVCPTEILKFNEMATKFRDIGCELLGSSVDSQYSHLQWMKTPRKDGGLGSNLNFPLIADLNGHLASAFGAMNKEDTYALRATYIIDKEGVLRHLSLNDSRVGRNVDEVFRLVQAIQQTDKSGEVCPVNWKPGEKTIIPDAEKKKEFFSKVKE